ncbi:hypothetical protein M9194_20840 [Vibrio sp. S4M6]|nr:hypothetical protein [Vibrio sinus]MCL9783873.1 hypothetical protein [Vibrio sinus]
MILVKRMEFMSFAVSDIGSFWALIMALIQCYFTVPYINFRTGERK